VTADVRQDATPNKHPATAVGSTETVLIQLDGVFWNKGKRMRVEQNKR
jgi:hypothetical protein